ncbi:MAG: tripartite tricarboxylate transporter substrate binding protein [Sedimentibacter sp.]|uniref:tripartite tricarboxylate transporter substrate binding protein n=1 Tax=Sedimentibacter sp. TaxID=1960295 RepID=UPI0031595101
MKRKLLSLILVLTMVLTVSTACSQKSEAPETKAETEKTQTEEPKATDGYPNKPITVYVGFSAGGSSDVMVRILASAMEKYIGQPVVVVNKTGAGGWVAWEELVKTVKPDGYTFALINTPNITLGAYDPVNPRNYTIDDFDLLANQVTDYNVIAIRKDETRYTDLASLIEYAKTNTLLSASSSTGIMSDDATVVEYFNMNYDTDFQVVQTAGAKDNETMFISGNTDILVANIADVLPAYKNGDYKIITIFAPEKSELLPDVPTVSELGFGDAYMFSARGYALPKGVDPEIKTKLMDAIRSAINDPEVINKLNELGAQTNYLEGQEYYDFLKSNIDISKKIYNIK